MRSGFWPLEWLTGCASSSWLRSPLLARSASSWWVTSTALPTPLSPETPESTCPSRKDSKEAQTMEAFTCLLTCLLCFKSYGIFVCVPWVDSLELERTQEQQQQQQQPITLPERERKRWWLLLMAESDGLNRNEKTDEQRGTEQREINYVMYLVYDTALVFGDNQITWHVLYRFFFFSIYCMQYFAISKSFF